MPYVAVITRTADGETRRYTFAHSDWHDDAEDGSGGDLFWWTEGNGGCDCNRAEMFAKAAGEPDPDGTCGETAYRIDHFELPDGRIVKCDD